MGKITFRIVGCFVILIAGVQMADAMNDEDLAKQLANPVAALISVPFQLNYDSDIGPVDEGERWTLNIQPVIPFSISENWNLISRTILPVISQDDIYPGAGSQDGIGDVVQSLFFSPKKELGDGWIVGAGPVFLLPTGSDDLLTADKWGAGPTGVFLRQQGPLTYGMLVNHIWSFAGDDDRDDVSASFIQPFFCVTTPAAWTFTLQAENTYNWEDDQWSVPIGLMASKVTSLGGQSISLVAGIRYWAESPDSGPKNWAGRFVVTFLFPK